MHLETYCGFLSIQTILSVSFHCRNCYQRSAFYWLQSFCKCERLTRAGKLQLNPITDGRLKNRYKMRKITHSSKWYNCESTLGRAMIWFCSSIWSSILADVKKLTFWNLPRNVDICSSNCLPPSRNSSDDDLSNCWAGYELLW